MFCSNCGNQLNDGVKFCGKCGEDQTVDDPPHASIVSVVNLEKKKSNIVFIIFTILFTIVGMLSYIFGFNYDGSFYDVDLIDFDVLVTISIVSTGIMLIGIIFAIIALYRKPNKLYFCFCILPCILLLLWKFVLSFWILLYWLRF